MKKTLAALAFLALTSCAALQPKQPAFHVGYGLIIMGNGGKTYPYVIMIDTNVVPTRHQKQK